MNATPEWVAAAMGAVVAAPTSIVTTVMLLKFRVEQMERMNQKIFEPGGVMWNMNVCLESLRAEVSGIKRELTNYKERKSA